MNSIDNIIEETLQVLKEEKYKLRMYQVELTLRISSANGVEETLQDIRSLSGVTVVTAINSTYGREKSDEGYTSQIKVKFHPQSEVMTADRYLLDLFLPSLRSKKIIPGTKVIRVGKPQKIQ